METTLTDTRDAIGASFTIDEKALADSLALVHAPANFPNIRIELVPKDPESIVTIPAVEKIKDADGCYCVVVSVPVSDRFEFSAESILRINRTLLTGVRVCALIQQITPLLAEGEPLINSDGEGFALWAFKSSYAFAREAARTQVLPLALVPMGGE